MGCWVYRIGGMPDHIHILFDLNPTVSMAEVMKTLKQNSSIWLTNNSDFSRFRGWGEGYFAVSVSPGEKEGIRQYIINQKSHHRREDILGELERLIRIYEMEWYPDDWGR